MTADSRHIAQTCLRDAAERLGWSCTLQEQSGSEGSFITLTPAGAATPIALVVSVLPHRSVYDDVMRHRAVTAAQRLSIPWIIITSFRTTIVYAVHAIGPRTPLHAIIATQHRGAPVLTLPQTLAAAARVAVTESLRRALQWIREQGESRPVTEHASVDTLTVLCTSILDELESCVQPQDVRVPPSARSSDVETIAACLIGYAVMSSLHPEQLPSLHIPYSIADHRLLLDVVDAYVRHAQRQGFALPDLPTAVEIDSAHEALSTSLLTDLIHILEGAQLSDWSAADIDRLFDAMSHWSASRRGAVIPSTDMIDLAIVAAGIADALPHTPIRVYEQGSSPGAIARRIALVRPRAQCVIDVNSMSSDPLSSIRTAIDALQRTSTIPAVSESKGASWDVACVTLSPGVGAAQAAAAIAAATVVEGGHLVLFLPTSTLREVQYASVRQALLTWGHLEWIFTSDVEPLTDPDGGMACLVLQRRPAESLRSAIVMFRVPLVHLIRNAALPTSFDSQRVERLRILLRYLTSSQRAKINNEVLVRRVTRSSLELRAFDPQQGWDEMLIPPDILASIIKKLHNKLIPIHEYGSVFSGLRTGANDVLMPDVATIAEQGLESEYWQRTLPSGRQVDAVVLTSADDVESPLGLPRSDRRLLMIPRDRASVEHSKVEAYLQQAEREGIHTRPSVRVRREWWHLEEPVIADIVVPKDQHHRWLCVSNSSQAVISDAYIGVRMQQPELADRLVLWMNSSLGLFVRQLLRTDNHVADVTVRDITELLVPPPATLQMLDPRQWKDVAYRPQQTVPQEFGATSMDLVRIDTIQRDRRRLDRFWMEEVFGLTEEEQRWVYRCALAWNQYNSNLAHLASALATNITLRDHLEPLWQWYQPRLDQLPVEATKTMTISDDVSHAEVIDSMFVPQVVLYAGKDIHVILDCTSSDEAFLIAELVNVGCRSLHLPTDTLIQQELAALVRTFALQLEKAVKHSLELIPQDLHEPVSRLMYALMTR